MSLLTYYSSYFCNFKNRSHGKEPCSHFSLKSYFPRDFFLEIHFCVILQCTQNFFDPSTPKIQSLVGGLEIREKASFFITRIIARNIHFDITQKCESFWLCLVFSNFMHESIHSSIVFCKTYAHIVLLFFTR